MPGYSLPYLSRISNVLFVIISGTAILYFAKPLLVPLVFALVLAMLLIPLSRRLERAGINRGLAAVICILILLLTIAVIVGLLTWQLSTVMDDIDQIKERIAAFVTKAQAFITQRTGIGWRQQQQIIKDANAGGSPASLLAQTTGAMLGMLVNIILVLVYIFLMMYFRDHLMQFITKAVPVSQKSNVAELVHEASKVSQQYLSGLALMIMTLWVMYGIGFSIIGVQYAIFFALLCGTLEIIPFIGNITGTVLAVVMGIVQGGDITLIAGILITYGVVQFTQSYILEPLIVGRGVNLNPFFTIVSIVIGEAVWGIPGMVLAVPMFGMIKIFCDHFDTLKPYGFLLGCEKEKSSTGIWDKLRKKFS